LLGSRFPCSIELGELMIERFEIDEIQPVGEPPGAWCFIVRVAADKRLVTTVTYPTRDAANQARYQMGRALQEALSIVTYGQSRFPAGFP
jgi:hypothetical protein